MAEFFKGKGITNTPIPTSNSHMALSTRSFQDDVDHGAMHAVIAIKNRKAGKCGCSRPLDNPHNRTNCIRCTVNKRGTNKAGMKATREARAALGLCSCGRQAVKGSKQCKSCRERDAERSKERKAKTEALKREGICTRCKERKAEKGRLQCVICKDYAKAYRPTPKGRT